MHTSPREGRPISHGAATLGSRGQMKSDGSIMQSMFTRLVEASGFARMLNRIRDLFSYVPILLYLHIKLGVLKQETGIITAWLKVCSGIIWDIYPLGGHHQYKLEAFGISYECTGVFFVQHRLGMPLTDPYQPLSTRVHSLYLASSYPVCYLPLIPTYLQCGI